ncbi:MAG: hypothetical protein R3E95_11350 [Thiolinea sp.]
MQADVTANTVADKALMQQLGLFGPPAIVFFDADGRERKAYRVVGFMDADEFASHLEQLQAAFLLASNRNDNEGG